MMKVLKTKRLFIGIILSILLVTCAFIVYQKLKGVKVSNDKKYLELGITEVGALPKGNFKSTYPGISIFWVQGSVADGSDECIAYDSVTKQIYASSYETSGFNPAGKVDKGSTYYKNKVISKEAALRLLKVSCYVEQPYYSV